MNNINTTRGYGKTTIAKFCGNLYGGTVDLQLTALAEDKLVTRLLTPSALGRRIVWLDNIKNGANSAQLEQLITCPTISGHRMFSGEATRPNNLTYLLTGNCPRASRDMAQRCFFIRLRKPVYRPDWERVVLDFLDKNRQYILADIAWLLSQPAQKYDFQERHIEWVNGVLSRCGGDTQAIVEMNQKRRLDSDDDLEEASMIREIISTRFRNPGESYRFVSSSDMCEALKPVYGKQLTTKSLNNRLKPHITAGRLPGVKHDHTRGGNGFQITFEDALNVTGVKDVKDPPIPSVSLIET